MTFKKNDVPVLPSIRHRPVITEDEMAKMETAAKRQTYSRAGNTRTRNGRTWNTSTKDGGRWMAARNYAIIRLSNLLGPRRIELFNLNLEDVHLLPEDEYVGEVLLRLTPQQRAVLDNNTFT